jgi:hypothetical protein
MPKMPPTPVLACVAILVAVFLLFVSKLKAAPTVTVPTYQPPINNELLLKAIAATENWDGESVGAAGERGPWQMLPSTWAMYSDSPFPRTRWEWHSAEANRVLHMHASWIRDQMDKKHLKRTAWVFAAFWKGGYGRVMNNRLRTVDKAYADRAQNNYYLLVK